VSPINVLVVRAVVAAQAEAIAKAIADSVAARPDMNLVQGSSEKQSGSVAVDDVADILRSLDPSTRCALVLVGSSSDINERVQEWFAARDDLAVMHVDVDDYVVRVGLRHSNLDSLLTALRELVESIGDERRERVTRSQLREVKSPPESGAPPQPLPPEHSLLDAAIKWVHALLRNAVENASDDVNGLTVTLKSLLESLEEPPETLRESGQRIIPDAVETLDKELDTALAKANAKMSSEPLAVAYRVFGLDAIGFRVLILALAPELDIRYQRCIGFLLDEIGRRVGTLSLYGSLLGITAPERDHVLAGGLESWLVFEGFAGRPPAADEPLRLDPFLAQWLLYDRAALAGDPRVRRILRFEFWPGSSLLTRHEERAKAALIIEKLQDVCEGKWIVLDSSDPAGWRALLELGATAAQFELIRAEPLRLLGVDVIDIEDCARRIARLARLTGHLLILDVTRADGADAEDDLLRVFFTTLESRIRAAAVVSREEARIVRLLGAAPFELEHELPLPQAARVSAVRAAAAEVGAYPTEESAEAIANRYPLHIDALEYAVRLARSRRPKNYYVDDPQLERLTTALKELASEGVSHLVDRIDPIFTLDQVVLPDDRKQQLSEIVDHVRLAPRVLDEWKFRDQLPYGRGVTALFSGASGTGKTMSAMAVARRLEIQLFRLDLSKVVSKYIGETEKNLDRVFTDAQNAGAVILIDEADALLGKRSEVKDAHDRYANIEVAYLLQRMEQFEGLAILTTNMRKNLDAAFMRRLRFIVEFPRPDVAAREQIWRQCLPAESHELNDTDFRQLARRLDLTGGQIRQVTLRAAFIAAAANKQINLEHVVQAARAELAKLGMSGSEIDLIQVRRAA